MATKKVNDEEVVETATEEVVKPTPKKAQAKKFGPSDMIPCRSVCFGELVMEGYKTKLMYTWANAGDVTNVEYQDLQALQSRKSRFLTDPQFIIEDEELVSQWSSMLKSIYDKIDEADIEEIMKLPLTKFRAKLKSSPEGVKNSIKRMAASKIHSGELDSISKIKAIDEILGTELITLIQ